ncbi:hypothetical protein ANANG_G00223740 [Anguilla anguilla]|uniref:Uncharacterized protein n=1 Tax=Anguilla anguilla TaxID=7936 RepID=A0A9D3LWM5_ANGAN|nr:hypothetical protein ANANG_G00223740 [Anguilla anguilla]
MTKSKGQPFSAASTEDETEKSASIGDGNDVSYESPRSSCLPSGFDSVSRTELILSIPVAHCKAAEHSPRAGIYILSVYPPQEYLMSDWQCDFFCFFRCC